MNRLITKKPPSNQKLTFKPMGSKPGISKAMPVAKKKTSNKPNSFAKKAASALAGKGDIGKHNNGKTTGFSAVASSAAKEYGSAAAGAKVAGAVLAKMRAKKQYATTN